MEYKVLYYENAQLGIATIELNKLVNRHLAQGWHIVGQASITINPAGIDNDTLYVIAQTMLLHDK